MGACHRHPNLKDEEETNLFLTVRNGGEAGKFYYGGFRLSNIALLELLITNSTELIPDVDVRDNLVTV